MVCFISVCNSIFCNKYKIFFLFRDIFYVTEESLITAKFLSYLPNSLLRVINNDTYEEISLVFNRLIPKKFTKNKVNYFILPKNLNPILLYLINSMVIHFLQKVYPLINQY
jgi:hypothetical protein